MDRGRILALILLGVGLFAFLARRAQAASAPQLAPVGGGTWAPEAPAPGGSTAWAPLDWSGWPSYPTGSSVPSQPEPVSQAPGAETGATGDVWEPAQVDPWGGLDWGLGTGTDWGTDVWGFEPIPEEPAPAPAPAPSTAWEPGANVSAFLKLIRTTEGTEANARGWSPYAVTYSYAKQITDFRDHPAALGWPGVPLPLSYCLNAGLPPGCVSTAAGAYQFNFPTWADPSLPAQPDFSPASQDRKAIDLLRAIGAYDALVRSDFDTALRLASQRWASLPYSSSGQPKVSYADAAAIYADAGGVGASGTTVATATIGIRG